MLELNISHEIHVVKLPHEDECFALFFAVADEIGVIAVAKATPWSHTGLQKPFISGVHVHEQWRRKGVARRLMQYIERGCRIDGVQSLALYVNRNNVAAGNLYQSLGFRPMLDDGDNIMFVKFLEPFTLGEGLP